METRSSRRFYRSLWAVHSWTGLYVGLVVAILSVSGSAVVFQDEIDAALNRSLLRVEPSSERASVTAMTDAAIQHVGDSYTLNVIRFPQSDEEVLQLDFVSNRRGGPPEIRQVLVNPYTGHVLGDRNYSNSLAYVLRHLHVRGFQMGYGRQFVGAFGIALLISVFTGFIVYGNFMRGTSFGQIRWRRGLRIVSADWHKVIGIAALLFNFVIAATGAWLGWANEILSVTKVQPSGMVLPMLTSIPRSVTPREDGNIRVDMDAVLESARRALPDVTLRSANLTRDGRRQVVLFGAPANGVYASASSKVLVDKVTLQVTGAFDPSRSAAGSKLYYLMEPLHFGTFAGTALKIVYGLFGLTAGFLSITGFVIYWKRQEARGDEAERAAARAASIRWPLGVIAGLTIALVLSVTIGPLYPSTVTTAATIAWPFWVVARALLKRWRTRQVRHAS